MMFAELALKFMDKSGINTDYQPAFLFNSELIPMDSCKSLDELKIRKSSAIEVLLSRLCISKVLSQNISNILFF